MKIQAGTKLKKLQKPPENSLFAIIGRFEKPEKFQVEKKTPVGSLLNLRAKFQPADSVGLLEWQFHSLSSLKFPFFHSKKLKFLFSDPSFLF